MLSLMNQASSVSITPSVHPFRLFAIRSLASLDTPETRAEMLRHRGAFTVTLAAAGVNMGRVKAKPSASFTDTYHHVLICWYDVTLDAFRLFAPSERRIDELTEGALALLDGSIHSDLDAAPIEDVDAAVRLMALMGVGGSTVEELYESVVSRNLHRYDDDFTPPSLDDLAALWATLQPYYWGGTSAAPSDLDVWVARTYAFGLPSL